MSRAAALLPLLLPIALSLAPGGAAGQDAPVLRGRVIAADGARTDGLRAFVRWRARGDTVRRADSADVDLAGRFVLTLPVDAADSLEVVVDAADRVRRTHHPALARLHRRDARGEQGFVLVPRRWTIPAGRYAGQAVAVSPHRARTPVCDRCSVFWVRTQGGPPHGPVHWQGWPQSRFPLRVGFDREHSLPAGAAPDSLAFWGAVAAFEDAFGMDLFRPAPYRETLYRGGDHDPGDVVLVVIDPTLNIPGLTMVLGRGGSVNFAEVSLQRRGVALGVRGNELVAHEMMHVLGFGHTCSWRSVSADLRRCPELRAETPTPEDVAHAQVLYRVRDLQRAGGARWGLDAAVAGERVIVLGLPEEP